ncbi:MAG: LacI family transcriptional regulator [Armatimonadetes bacterium]|nr:LacI family transcriptional regulator [Armatimonadota bacterium]
MQRATIADVARMASVGKVTVSYVLNGRAKEVGISTETAERIVAVAKELDYRPNRLARMLAGKKTDMIAVVFQEPNYFSLGSTFLNEVLRGVAAECVEQDLDLMLHTRRSDNLHLEADALSDGRIDGVLILRDEDDETLRALISRKFPLVLFFSRATDPGIAYVDCDNFTGGKIAAQHLVGLGHKNLGIVLGKEKSVDSSDRFQGFRSVLETAKLDLDPRNITHFESPTSSASEVIAMLQGPNRPTGLFIWSDDVAFQCMRIIQEMGLRIPEDISLVGFDSTPACNMVQPNLTSVRQPVEEMARAATKILSSITRGGSDISTQLVFPPNIDVRASTCPPAKYFKEEII